MTRDEFALAPLVSPYCLMQESLWPNEWLILVSCVMLNRTKRKQVEKIFPEFLKRFKTCESILRAERSEIEELLRPLGFKKRRTQTLYKLATAYLSWDRTDVKTLPGIGEYASRAWEIFVRNELGSDEPQDGALKLYWLWRRKHERKETANDQR